jgi:hypothetical protein
MNFDAIKDQMRPGDIVRRTTWEQGYYLDRTAEGVIRLRRHRMCERTFSPPWAKSGYDALADDYYFIAHLKRDDMIYALRRCVDHTDLERARVQLSRHFAEQTFSIDLSREGYVLVRFADAPEHTDPIVQLDFEKRIPVRI